jgi:hypothetical protein
METQLANLIHKIGEKSPTRLEGMETLDAIAGGLLLEPGLRPALRGWKHLSKGGKASWGEGLRPALRGWKLRHKLDEAVLEWVSDPP